MDTTPDARFARCDALIDQWEGGAAYSDNPKDPGGPTRHGITLATLSQWRGHLCVAADVQALTGAEASAIRRGLYWSKVQGDQLPAGLDLMVYDAAINMGVGSAGRTLQTVLDLTVDGIVGPYTLAAVDHTPSLGDLIGRFAMRRAALYRAMAGFETFGAGWLRRVDACEAAAKAMLD